MNENHDTIKQLLAKNNIMYENLIILYGLSHTGKTSTLYQLLKLIGMASSKVSSAAITAFVKSQERIDAKTGRLYYADCRIIIPFDKILVAIATYGDGREVCEDNMHFFRMERDKTPQFYWYNGTKFVPYKKRDKNKDEIPWEDITPTVFVSACRTTGGAVRAMNYCADYYLQDILSIHWIHKIGCDYDYTKTRLSIADKKYADVIFEEINTIKKFLTTSISDVNHFLSQKKSIY